MGIDTNSADRMSGARLALAIVVELMSIVDNGELFSVVRTRIANLDLPQEVKDMLEFVLGRYVSERIGIDMVEAE